MNKERSQFNRNQPSQILHFHTHPVPYYVPYFVRAHSKQEIYPYFYPGQIDYSTAPESNQFKYYNLPINNSHLTCNLRINSEKSNSWVANIVMKVSIYESNMVVVSDIPGLWHLRDGLETYTLQSSVFEGIMPNDINAINELIKKRTQNEQKTRDGESTITWTVQSE